MSAQSSNRLLTIGEFAAATQLSPKALRLYDEQKLLQPARIDSASGYRYYRSDQVAQGRLIRTLRDMDLSLAEVAQLVATDGVRAEALLRQFSNNLDQRYAREKRAYQTALLLLRDTTRAERPQIEERTRPATIADDILLLEQAMPIYDALYAWRKKASRETHGWPQTQRTHDLDITNAIAGRPSSR